MQTSTKSDFFYEEPSFFCVQVEISPMHIEYMTYMRGMDVADQMWGVYEILVQMHKWWYRIFWFLVDTSLVNMFILHINICEELGGLEHLPHLEFHIRVAKALINEWNSNVLSKTIHLKGWDYKWWENLKFGKDV